MHDMVSGRFETLRMELRRGTLVFAVLLALQEEEYGYSLRKKLKTFDLDVDEGTLYPLIRRLEKQELLISRWSKEEGSRKRRYYHTSEIGNQLLEELQAEWKSINQSINQLLEQTS